MSQTNPFPFYFGSQQFRRDSEHKDSRCVVMNILGGESKGVTPTSHEFSGGNVVAGVQYGRSGEENGNQDRGYSRYYGSVKEIVDDGIEFDTGVIYLPASCCSCGSRLSSLRTIQN